MQNKNIVKVALVQMSMSNDKQSNLDKALNKIKESASKGADIVCLPELFNLQYFPQTENDENFKLAEEIPGPATNAIGRSAKENRIVVVAGSVFEKSKGKFFNTSVVFDKDGSILGKYSKVHIPHDPYFFEKKYFSSGNEYKVFNTPFAKIGVLICYDQWFPEAARATALKEAQIIFYPTAIGWFEELRNLEPFSQKRWERDQCSHASSNGVYVVAANRVGKENKIDFWGNSFVADPFGNVIARATGAKEEIVMADINLSLIESSREGWGFLRNRMPKTYSSLVERHG